MEEAPGGSTIVKVLMVINSLANGGLERQLSLLVRSLPDEVERRVWSLDGGPHAAGILAAGIPLRVRARRFRLDVTPAADLWRAIGGWRPDVVHAWEWMPSAAAAPSCQALGIPLIDGSIRMGSVPQQFGRPRRGIMRFAELVVANSAAGLAAWRIGADKGRVVYNAFEDGRIAAAGPREGAPGRPRPFTVVMAARMDPPKDFLAVIEAARLLGREDPEGWRFVLVGDGIDRSALLAAGADLVAAGRLSFPQVGIEAVEHMLSADAGVLMSDPAILAEGCPNSIMEYMACGLPVVCADSGGCRELTRDGETGFVVPPRDAGALAARLTYLRDHPDEGARMGEAGRARVATEFTLERMVSDYAALYAEAVRRSEARR